MSNGSKPCLTQARLGWCLRGDTCLYAASHQWDVDVLKRRSMCSYFRKGLPCPYGAKCLWLHEEHREPCRNFQRGFCTKGENCMYAHVKQGTESPQVNASASNNCSRPKHPRTGKGRKRKADRPTRTPAPQQPPENGDKNQKDAYKSESGTTESKTPKPASATADDCSGKQKKPHPTGSERDNHHHKHPKATAPIVPGAQGIDAYKRGDFREAIAVFDKTLLGTLEHATRISLISNRAHAYEKLALRTKEKALLEKAVEDCDRVMTLVGSNGHFKTTFLRARISLDKECADDAIHFAKSAAKLSSTADEKIKAMDLLDRAMAARIAARRRADELEKAAAAERKRVAEQQRRAQRILDSFEWMEAHEILGVSGTASASEVRSAYRKLAMKYHPDRPDGDHKVFQKIEEAFRELS